MFFVKWDKPLVAGRPFWSKRPSKEQVEIERRGPNARARMQAFINDLKDGIPKANLVASEMVPEMIYRQHKADTSEETWRWCKLAAKNWAHGQVVLQPRGPARGDLEHPAAVARVE